jgi:hypothetical protein
MGDQDFSQRSSLQEAIASIDATYANWTERDDDLLLLYLHSSLPGGLNDEHFTWVQITNKMNENVLRHGINKRYTVLSVRLHYEQYLKPLIITTHSVACISTTRDAELDVINPAMARSRREHIPFCCRWCHMQQEAAARRAREEEDSRSTQAL